MIPASPKRPKILVLLHCFYTELWPEIKTYLDNLGDHQYDLFVSLPRGMPTSDACARMINKEYSQAQIFMVENRGQDIGAAIHVAEFADLASYDLVLKVHTKKSAHMAKGAQWRRELLESVLGSKQRVDDIVSMMRSDPSVGMVGSQAWISDDSSTPTNIVGMNVLCHQFGLPKWGPNSRFVSGTIFWTRPDVFIRIQESGVRQRDFHKGYEQDITYAHALERVFGCLAQAGGRQIVGL